MTNIPYFPGSYMPVQVPRSANYPAANPLPIVGAYNPGASYFISEGFYPRPGEFHAGADYPAPVNTPVLAAADGVITNIGSAGGYGSWIIVKSQSTSDNTQFSTLYGHVIPVGGLTLNSSVSAGQVIGTIGSKAALQAINSWVNMTGPHL